LKNVRPTLRKKLRPKRRPKMCGQKLRPTQIKIGFF
jgi:hypothetical protein